MRPTLVIDNGAADIKAGFATPHATAADCLRVPNCIARTRDRRVLVAAQLESCRDFGGMAFRRPVEKGYLVNWEAEKDIWDRTFLEDGPLKCDPHETTLLLTEAPNAPAGLQTNCDQMVFEEYEFTAYHRTVGATLVPWNPIHTLYTPPPLAPPPQPAPATLVIDSGFSHTHVIPLLHGRVHQAALRRINVGGKFLTNLLKETVSLRTWNMMEEPYIINSIKESCSFVSTSFSADLDACHRLPNAKNPIIRDYVLPDYNAGKHGYLRPHAAPKKPPATSASTPARTRASSSSESPPPRSSKVAKADETVMVLGNERFSIPEVLFNPSDVGLRQAGIAEAAMQVVDAAPEAARAALLANVVVVGGNARIPGLRERLEMELRPMAPQEAVVRVAIPEDPVAYAWLGGVRLACAGDGEVLQQRAVTRQEYLEHGAVWTARRLNGETVLARDEDDFRRRGKKRRVETP